MRLSVVVLWVVVALSVVACGGGGGESDGGGEVPDVDSGGSDSLPKGHLLAGLRFKQLAAGEDFVIYVDDKQNGWAAGFSMNGGMGVATYTNMYATGLVATDLSVMDQVVTDGAMVTARFVGQVYRWGKPKDRTEAIYSPVAFPGLADVVDIGSDIALKSDGTVWTINSPAVAIDGLTGIVDIAGELANGWAIDASGAVFHTSSFGSLKVELMKNAPKTKKVVPVPFQKTLLIDVADNLWAWPKGESASETPVQIASGVKDVAAYGAGSALIAKLDGTAWTINVDTAAQNQVAGLSGVVSVAASAAGYFALLDDGRVKAWGGGRSGEYANGSLVKTYDTPTDAGIYRLE
jgi:hypothetical protein